MTADPATELAAALAMLGITAVPAYQSVRAWIGGVGSGDVLISPGWNDSGEPVWSWRHRGKAASHPRGDIDGAARVITRSLGMDPP